MTWKEIIALGVCLGAGVGACIISGHPLVLRMMFGG
jgi:hypothetical protein